MSAYAATSSAADAGSRKRYEFTEDDLRQAIWDMYHQSVSYTLEPMHPDSRQWYVEAGPSDLSGIYDTISDAKNYGWVFEPDEISAVATRVRQSKSSKKEKLPAFGDDLDAAILGGEG